MNKTEILQITVIGTVLLGGAYVAITQATGTAKNSPVVTVDVTLPPLTEIATEGQVLFDNNCASCHGLNGSGTKAGPPLIHDIYNPGHHSDKAFYQAVKTGVKQHHWPYGNMPARSTVSTSDVAKIVTYVREVQKANGINYKPHRM